MLTFELSQNFEKELYTSLKALYNDVVSQGRLDACITKEYLTSKEVNDFYVSVSAPTLKQWENLGLPVYQIQGKQYYKKSDIDSFLQQYKKIKMPSLW